MKKYFFYFLFLFSFINSIFAIELDIYSKNAILYNLDENTILYEKNSEEQIAIASMTKIATAIVAIENIADLDDEVTLVASDFYGLAEANASVANFYVGQKLTYRDLLYGLLHPSGADAAQALTRLVAGNKEDFVKLMNELAARLGLENTNFENETGLDEEGHLSSVSDVAKLMMYALQNEDFYEIITNPVYRTSDNYITLRSSVSNYINRYNYDMDYLLGGKTGTTKDAGRCLASIAYSNGTNYLLVTARAGTNGEPENVLDAKNIYSYFIDNFANTNYIAKDDELITIKTKYSDTLEVTFKAEENYSKYLTKDFAKEDLEINYEGIQIITPDMKENSKLGTVEIIYEDELLTTIDIILEEEIPFSLIAFIKVHKMPFAIGAFGIIILLAFIIIRKKRKRRK